MTHLFMTAKEVAEELDVSISSAYTIIKGWNAELKEKGYFVKSGSVPTAYFREKCYGSKNIDEVTKVE